MSPAGRCIAAAVLVLACAGAAGAQVDLTFDVIHNLSPPDPANPDVELVQGVDGNFYGMTASGGAFNAGTIFKITASGAVTILHEFTGGADGGARGIPSGYDRSALIQATDGNFYGDDPGRR